MIEDPAPGLLVVRGTALLARFPDPRSRPDCSPRYYARDRQASRQPGFPEVFAAAHLIVAWLRAEIIPGSRISMFLTPQSCMPSIRRREFRFGMSFPTSRGASGSSAS
jgi:hypothetical protein